MDKEYAPISGPPEFCKASINLALGEGNEWVQNGLVSTSLLIVDNFMVNNYVINLRRMLLFKAFLELVHSVLALHSCLHSSLVIRKFTCLPLPGEIIFLWPSMLALLWNNTDTMTPRLVDLTSMELCLILLWVLSFIYFRTMSESFIIFPENTRTIDYPSSRLCPQPNRCWP